MRVLSIGSDPSLLQKESASFRRQQTYAAALGVLDIVNVGTRSALSCDTLTVHGASRLSACRVACALPRPDVVTAQDPFELGLIALFVARHFQAPLHVQLHTDPFDPDFIRAHWPINHVRRLIMGFVLPRAARIRVVSERVKQAIEVRYALKAPITVLPIFVDTARFKQAQPSDTLAPRFAGFSKKILVVSRLETEKNITLAIEAFANGAPESACLIIIGEGRARATLERHARALGVASRVLFEGRQDPFPYYQLVDLVLVPSRYEGYGLVIVEALAAGKPVIATDVGIARDAGAIVADESDFAVAMENWFENGPRSAHLRNYPYENEAEYISRYCADIHASID